MAARTAAPRPRTIRAATIGRVAPTAISSGWYSACHCGTPSSNSSWKALSPIRTTTTALGTRPLRTQPRPALRPASASSSQAAIGARAAPPIISRWVGPHMVTSTP